MADLDRLLMPTTVLPASGTCTARSPGLDQAVARLLEKSTPLVTELRSRFMGALSCRRIYF